MTAGLPSRAASALQLKALPGPLASSMPGLPGLVLLGPQGTEAATCAGQADRAQGPGLPAWLSATPPSPPRRRPSLPGGRSWPPGLPSSAATGTAVCSSLGLSPSLPFALPHITQGRAGPEGPWGPSLPIGQEPLLLRCLRKGRQQRPGLSVPLLGVGRTGERLGLALALPAVPPLGSNARPQLQFDAAHSSCSWRSPWASLAASPQDVLTSPLPRAQCSKVSAASGL